MKRFDTFGRCDTKKTVFSILYYSSLCYRVYYGKAYNIDVKMFLY